ncbi:MAG: leucine-rich repeat protein, partial [Clostridia bacterium]|nr:leucine-rich repeat protein [Clostridia bacterium]
REETVNLAAIHLPNSLKSIRKQAFQYCTKLFRISLPRGLRYVGPMAFMGCKSLTELVLPVFTETFSASALEGTGLSMPPTIPGLCHLVRQPEPVRNYDGIVLFPGSRISFRS